MSQEKRASSAEAFFRKLSSRGGPQEEPAGEPGWSRNSHKHAVIQGLMQRGYKRQLVRQFVLQVNVLAKARELFGRLVRGRKG